MDPRGAPAADRATRTNDTHRLFVDQLLLELRYTAQKLSLSPRTIFVGGGTPTLLHPDLWRRLLDGMANLGLLYSVCEFTVEANPETVTAELMATLAAGGVNRVSIGAQTFDRELLEVLGRWHDPRSVAHAVRVTLDAGIDNINLDLIFGIPGQTLDRLDDDLNTALALHPNHLSYYGLTYEPNTALTQRLKLARLRRVPERLEQQMYARLIDRLPNEGFVHYEVSNWARPGKKCAHNLMYWVNRDWVGVGPAAASHVGGHRWKNLPDLKAYLAHTGQPPTADHEHLPPSRAVGEELMLRLRTRQGVPLIWLDTHMPADDRRRVRIDDLAGLNMVEYVGNRLRLTPRGLLVADSIIAELL